MLSISASTTPVSHLTSMGNVTEKVQASRQGDQPSAEAAQTTRATISSEGLALSYTDQPSEVNSTLVETEAPVYLRMKSGAQQSDERNQNRIDYYIKPRLLMDSALSYLKKEVAKIQNKIEINRPGMVGKKWDMVLTDGKVTVTGDALNAKDKQWLENTLNRNSSIVNAVKTAYSSVVKRYENTQDNPYATMATRYHGDPVLYVVDVEKQINGKIPIRELMAKTEALHSDDAEPARNPYGDALRFSQDYLQGSRMPKFIYENYDTSDPVTAAYVKAHPGV